MILAARIIEAPLQKIRTKRISFRVKKTYAPAKKGEKLKKIKKEREARFPLPSLLQLL